MATDRLKKYIWIIDTIKRHGKITRSKLSRLWQSSAMSDGNPLPHRSFFTYRRAIENELGISIKCNSAHEYFIDTSATEQDEAFSNWIVDSYAMRALMDDNRDIADRIHVEPVPSAREYLSTVLDAIRNRHCIVFTYASFARPKEEEILFEPMFVKLFRQRWYVVGHRLPDSAMRTYALDRVREMEISEKMFAMPEHPTAEEYFSDLFGITQSHAAATCVKLRTTLQTAKYLRALPLHQSQKEDLFSNFSIFKYDMKLTQDLVSHLLSLGSEVEVLEPRSLRLMMIKALKETISLYE